MNHEIHDIITGPVMRHHYRLRAGEAIHTTDRVWHWDAKKFIKVWFTGTVPEHVECNDGIKRECIAIRRKSMIPKLPKPAKRVVSEPIRFYESFMEHMKHEPPQ